MSSDLSFVADWEALDRGDPEDRACFAALGIEFGGIWLTEAEDGFAKSLRKKPYLSAYRLAEWLAWNWWRLRWEPRTLARDWPLAHRMASIGHGYIWPNITIFSDGERVALLAEPTGQRSEEPLRYIANCAAVVPATTFETAIDGFLEQVRGRLRVEGIVGSNFENIWREVLVERGDPDHALRRKFEALLGGDPDGADERAIEQLFMDAQSLGPDAMGEIAADHPRGSSVLTAAALHDIAGRSGFAGSSADKIRLSPGTILPNRTDVPAWRLGAHVAKLLRQQERLGDDPISDARLAGLGGVRAAALAKTPEQGEVSFILNEDRGATRTVLRSKRNTGRRFELARLIGDRLTNPASRLFPATRAYTYRQKVQRSFAAEFLAPWDEVRVRLDDDYSPENLLDVADHFRVSELTIRTLLVNHHKLEREDLDIEFNSPAVA